MTAAAGQLVVALDQFGAALGDVATNLARVRASLAGAARDGADLVVFPELCLSGYLLDRAAYHDRLLDDVAQAEAVIAADATRLRVTVVYGAPVRAGDGLANAVLLVGADARRVVYAKTHMDANERRVFTPGERFVVDEPSATGLLCCYDLAFPEPARIVALHGARVLVVPMAWEVARGFVLHAVLAARAVENISYVVCVNQTGLVGSFQFLGASGVIDPLGNTVTTLGTRDGRVLVTLDREWVRRLRLRHDERSYPLFGDRRPDIYTRLVAGVRDPQPGGEQ
jgi:5-aminopentanamidase